MHCGRFVSLCVLIKVTLTKVRFFRIYYSTLFYKEALVSLPPLKLAHLSYCYYQGKEIKNCGAEIVKIT